MHWSLKEAEGLRFNKSIKWKMQYISLGYITNIENTGEKHAIFIINRKKGAQHGGQTRTLVPSRGGSRGRSGSLLVSHPMSAAQFYAPAFTPSLKKDN